MDYKTLGQNIRRLRVTQGFRQEDLAEKCECSASHIGQIENGRVKPSLEMTVRIANALNATTDQLLAHEFSRPEGNLPERNCQTNREIPGIKTDAGV